MRETTEGHVDLSIVTVSYNTGAVLIDCLRSVYERTREVSFEYYVVENAVAVTETVDLVRAEFPQVHVMESPTNVGFGAGCNAVIERARGRYVLLLNGDCVIYPGALDRLVGFMDERPDVAMLGCPLLYPDGKDQGVAARGFPTMLAFLFGRKTTLTKLFPGNRISTRFSAPIDKSRREPRPVDWVSGACMVVRKDAIDQVGMMDPGYFMSWEDADWCYRFHQAGLKIFCYHEPLAVHREGYSRYQSLYTHWITTISFHQGAYRYYRKHLRPGRFSAIHVVAVGALIVRTAFMLMVGYMRMLIMPPEGEAKPASEQEGTAR